MSILTPGAWHPTKNLPLQYESKLLVMEKYWWLGDCTHEWEAILRKQRENTNHCPYCKGTKVLAGFNDLATKSPQVAAEWHPQNTLKASEVSEKSNRRVQWICNKGHEWKATPGHRATGNACPYCRGFAVLPGVNDLATTHALVAAEWHPTRNSVTPTEIKAGSKSKVWWVGACSHEWEAAIYHRTSMNSGCPYCSNHRVSAGFNDLATRHPQLADQWHPTKNSFSAQEVTLKSDKMAWWKDSLGHEWDARISDRTKDGVMLGCPICSGNRVLAGFNDLATKNPRLAEDWHPTKNAFKASETTSATPKKAWWLGKICRHEWESTILSRNDGNNCPICSGKQVLAGFNDLGTTHPEIAAQWHPTKNAIFTPQSVNAGSGKKVWWVGSKCGHEWVAPPYERTTGHGCSVCHGSTVMVGVNDFASLKPELVKEWHPTKNGDKLPSQFTVGSKERIWWVGACNHEWPTSIKSRSMGSSCRKCSNNVSKAEKEIAKFIQGLGFLVETSNRKVLKRKELDILVTEENLAIEFNGLYWHTETAGKSPTYHSDKWAECKSQGIRLIQIWEDQWNEKSSLVKKMLHEQLALNESSVIIHPVVSEISERRANDFMDSYSILGYEKGTHFIGISDDTNILREVVVLDFLHSSSPNTAHIVGYASSDGGREGLQEMLSYVSEMHQMTSYTSFSHHVLPDEDFYENNGFIAEKMFAPDYMYVVRKNRYPKSDYPIERFKDDPALLWEDGLTLRELEDLNGLNRIWDAGRTLYRLST